MVGLVCGLLGFFYGMIFGLGSIYLHEFHDWPFWVVFPLSMIVALAAAIGSVYALFAYGWLP